MIHSKQDPTTYSHPLVERYNAKPMSSIFSPENRIRIWRTLWVVLAEEQKKLGIPITQEQLDELNQYKETISYELANQYEKQFKHEVFSQIQAYGSQCPKAQKIIHLGATSAYVMDNGDLIQIREALILLKKQLLGLINALKDFCLKHKDTATLAYTHYQPAQPTTVGKRASLWLQDLVYDYHELDHRLKSLFFLGVKGATGSQASFLSLFDGNAAKVQALDHAVAKRMGFEQICCVTGQTYSRKLDYMVLSALSSLAQSAHKFSNDLRLLQNLGELQEPFGKRQVGSSAMPYKQNPILSERIASLARYVINQAQNPAFTFASQWLERTLDDSANRRLCIPESFLGTYVVLSLYYKIISGLTVQKQPINNRLNAFLEPLLTENILMESVKKGADRQKIHEVICGYTLAKQQGSSPCSSDLLEQLAQDKHIPLNKKEIQALWDAQNLTGLSSTQVEVFVQEVDALIHTESKLLKGYVFPEIEV